MGGPKQEKVPKPRVLRLYCWISSMRVSEKDRSVRDDIVHENIKKEKKTG